jgi:hypothetical protein
MNSEALYRNVVNISLFSILADCICGLVATDPEVWVRFPALSNFLRSSGSGMEPTKPPIRWLLGVSLPGM